MCSREKIVLFQRNQVLYDNSNRMRSLHACIKEEYGQKSIFLLQQWENLEKKMANYVNHRRFTIKCLKSEVVPVSIRLKTNVKTSKGFQIIRRAEKQLVNEHIRSINNTLELLMLKRDTCIKEFQRYHLR